MLAVVDAGPLYAVTDTDDEDHERSLAVLQRPDLQLVILTLVVAEVTPRIAELVERYGDFPLGGADASVVALAERLGTEVVITLDRRHFGAVRPRHRPAFQLLPA